MSNTRKIDDKDLQDVSGGDGAAQIGEGSGGSGSGGPERSGNTDPIIGGTGGTPITSEGGNDGGLSEFSD